MKDKLNQYLKELKKQEEYWLFKIEHSVYVGNINKEHALWSVKGKIEAVHHILMNYCN